MKNPSNKCEYCGKILSSQSNLAAHVKTAKYCLNLRGKNIPANYECEYCESVFTTKAPWNLHMERCKIMKEMETEKINSLQKKIDRLEKEVARQKSVIEKKNLELEHYAKELKLEKNVSKNEGIVIGMTKAKPRVVKNNITTNIVNQKLSKIPIDYINPFTLDYVECNLHEYDYNTFLKGNFGVVDFIKGLTMLDMGDGTTQINYACTNPSTQNFHRLIENRVWNKDAGAKFIGRVLDMISESASEYMKEFMTEMNRKVKSGEVEYYSRKQPELLSFEIGLLQPKSREREDILNYVKGKLKKSNAC